MRSGAGENGEGGFRANTGDVVKKKSKKVAFPRREKSVKSVGVLSNHEVSEESDFLPGLREMVECGYRDQEVVSDALAVDDRAGGPRFGESALKKSDHVRRLQESCARKRLHDVGG